MMRRFFDEMDRRFDTVWNPAIEIFQRDGNLVVRADLPGIQQDQISVTVEHDVLTITGTRSDDRTEQREGYYHSERSYGSFQRSIALPRGVTSDNIHATFENGVLEVTAPMAPEQTARKVEIGGPKRPQLKGN